MRAPVTRAGVPRTTGGQVTDREDGERESPTTYRPFADLKDLLQCKT